MRLKQTIKDLEDEMFLKLDEFIEVCKKLQMCRQMQNNKIDKNSEKYKNPFKQQRMEIDSKGVYKIGANTIK